MLASLDIPRFACRARWSCSPKSSSTSNDWPTIPRCGAATLSVGGVEQGTDPATASFSVTIAADGSLSKGRIDVDHVSWGGLFRLEDLSFVGERTSPTRFVWAATARLAIGDGPTTTVSGSMVIENGRVLEGELHRATCPSWYCS